MPDFLDDAPAPDATGAAILLRACIIWLNHAKQRFRASPPTTYGEFIRWLGDQSSRGSDELQGDFMRSLLDIALDDYGVDEGAQLVVTDDLHNDLLTREDALNRQDATHERASCFFLASVMDTCPVEATRWNVSPTLKWIFDETARLDAKAKRFLAHLGDVEAGVVAAMAPFTFAAYPSTPLLLRRSIANGTDLAQWLGKSWNMWHRIVGLAHFVQGPTLKHLLIMLEDEGRRWKEALPSTALARQHYAESALLCGAEPLRQPRFDPW